MNLAKLDTEALTIMTLTFLRDVGAHGITHSTTFFGSFMEFTEKRYAIDLWDYAATIEDFAATVLASLDKTSHQPLDEQLLKSLEILAREAGLPWHSQTSPVTIQKYVLDLDADETLQDCMQNKGGAGYNLADGRTTSVVQKLMHKTVIEG